MPGKSIDLTSLTPETEERSLANKPIDSFVTGGGLNADHLFGPNADRAECRRAECRPQPVVLGRNADYSRREQESAIRQYT